MKRYMTNNLDLYNMDCMELMKHFPDKYFDLAILDPPYFSGPEKRTFYGKDVSTTNVKRVTYKKSINTWEVPGIEYFNEVKRVSKKYIIFGCNYYEFGNQTPGRIIWDKVNGSSTFSDCEIAMTNIHDSVRMFRYMWNGMMQGKSIDEGHIMQGKKSLNEVRIHPTQKPVILYNWILRQYAKEGFNILDTNLGSGSSAIACENGIITDGKTVNFNLVGCDINKDCFADMIKRITNETSQQRLF